jgi:DNA invertase Pin-like site-specific DNA recombinase
MKGIKSMPRTKLKKMIAPPPTPGWAVYLRTSSDDNQKPELSRARQRIIIEGNVLNHSDMPVIDEYIDVLTGKTPNRTGYQRLLADARVGKFSHVIVERADRFGRNDTEALRAIDELHSPDLDPIDPDDRIIVALSFTLARRESALLGIRARGGQQAKRKGGGHISLAPDGYRNIKARTDTQKRSELGRWNTWMEQDPERAKVIRQAFDMLLEDNLTFREIAEALHADGHRHRSGRPFIEVTLTGLRKANVSSLCNIFHNWTYAGWVVSLKNGIVPKTVRGNWTPIVTTEEFELVQSILARRNLNRQIRRKQFYLLTGLLFYRQADGELRRMTGSTSNASRRNGGTPYYRIVDTREISFLCNHVDKAVEAAIASIQVDSALIPTIRANYTEKIQTYLGHGSSDRRVQMCLLLKQIDDEEARAARLFASGKISDEVWDSLWTEWQDRRHTIQRSLEATLHNQIIHVENLEVALEIIGKIGTLYNGLEDNDKKELLHHVVEKVIVEMDGKVSLELRSPFLFLKTLVEDIQNGNFRIASAVKRGRKAKKNGEDLDPTVPAEQCSNHVQKVWGTWIRTKINGSKVRCPAIGRFPNLTNIVA